MTPFAARLAAARKARPMTQEEAGAAVGVDPSTIANWEHGRGEPKASQIVRLALAYDLAAGDLFRTPEEARA